MIDRNVLKQMGFVQFTKDDITGANCDVWVCESNFSVHFEGENSRLGDSIILGNDSMENFFKKFIANIENSIRERAYVAF